MHKHKETTLLDKLLHVNRTEPFESKGSMPCPPISEHQFGMSPDAALNGAAGLIRAQVLVCITCVDDADCACDAGRQALNRTVKDRKCDCKRGSDSC